MKKKTIKSLSNDGYRTKTYTEMLKYYDVSVVLITVLQLIPEHELKERVMTGFRVMRSYKDYHLVFKRIGFNESTFKQITEYYENSSNDSNNRG